MDMSFRGRKSNGSESYADKLNVHRLLSATEAC